jgi:hypothetical protein
MGLLGTMSGLYGCSRQDAREVGKETGEAVKDVKEATRDAAQGFREGFGGSGTESDKDADVGRKEGVINDGEGPFEQPRQPGEEPNILHEGKGPLEENESR